MPTHISTPPGTSILPPEAASPIAVAGFGGEWRPASVQPVPYPQALAEMEARVRDVAAGHATDLVWPLEHPPIYTSGSSARRDDLHGAEGVEVFAAGRGGQWTYHGPGQRVVYLVLDLNRPRGTVAARDLRAYIHGLERWMLAALAQLGVKAEQRCDRIGLWVPDPAHGRENKIAAIGVRITRWVAWHGVAINVAPNLAHFGGIVPCGISDHGVTSLAALGLPASMDDLDRALRQAWAGVFGDAP